MEYASALRRLFSLTDFERMAAPRAARRRYDLSRVTTLLERLGNPHLRVPTVHVTGTKGKGSTAAMIASALRHGGQRVGLYTSPHLHTVRERVRIDGDPIDEQTFGDAVERLWPVVESIGRPGSDEGVSFFEMLTAMAFHLFAREGLDWQVLEVGLGGTLDATNVVERPRVCVLTSISLDHTAVLGDTVEQIAQDKAGIIKPGAAVVVAPQPPLVAEIIAEASRAKGARLVSVADDYEWSVRSWDLGGQSLAIDGPRGAIEVRIPLLGAHQAENAACAVAALDALADAGAGIPPEGVIDGLARVEWPCRLEVLQRSPLVVADGAHNPYSMSRLVEAMRYHFPDRRCILVYGCSWGHDLEGMAREAAALSPVAVLATRSRHPRAVPSDTVVEAFATTAAPARVAGTVAEGLDLALRTAGPDDVILATGSLFTAAEARERLLGIRPELYEETQGTGTARRVR